MIGFFILMPINFYKYQSSGNSFVIIDNLENKISFNKSQIVKLCDFNYGIGSDGVMIIRPCKESDFELQFFNPDGSKSFCGNGSLCALHFLKNKKFINKYCNFIGFDGIHEAKINDEIYLKMKNIDFYEKINNDFYINSGAPHYVKFIDHNLKKIDIYIESMIIKTCDFLKKNPCNINFVSLEDEHTIYVRTFEKGIDRETLSCGTGAIASAIAFSIKENRKINYVRMRGGTLRVTYKKNKNNTFSDIYLIGNPKNIYNGKISI